MKVEMVRMKLVQGRGVQWSELLAGLGLAKTNWLVKVCRQKEVFRRTNRQTHTQRVKVRDCVMMS